MKRWMVIIIALMAIGTQNSHAQIEDELGAWYMYWGANRVSERFSIHSEVQYRLNQVLTDRSQFFIRLGLNWHVSEVVMITGGYGYFLSWDPLNPELLVEQAVIRSPIGKWYVEHRYRIEQRWIGNNGVYDHQGRVRYRLYTEYPLNRPERIAGAITFVAYDEIFLNTDVTNVFDQTRLYFAFGYFFSDYLSTQAGFLLQTISGNNLSRLQLAIVYNPDLRK